MNSLKHTRFSYIPRMHCAPRSSYIPHMHHAPCAFDIIHSDIWGLNSVSALSGQLSSILCDFY